MTQPTENTNGDPYPASIKARWTEQPNATQYGPDELMDERCDLCRDAPVGFYEHGDAYLWAAYLGVRGDGDIRETRFCEDCAGWLADASSAIKDAMS